MTPTPQEHAVPKEIATAPVESGERVVITGMSGLYPDSHYIKDLQNILYNKVTVHIDFPIFIKSPLYNCVV